MPHYHPGRDEINLNIEKDTHGDPNRSKEPYEQVLHESGHAIDHAIVRKNPEKYVSHYSSEYNNGEFSKTLKQEADSYIKNYQAELSQKRGKFVSIGDARDSLGLRTYTDSKAWGITSDILEGATKGKFSGVAGHGKKYWNDQQYYGIRIPGTDVAEEAFAHFFSLSANPKAEAKIKEVFPESYNCFLRMVEEASNL